MAIKKRGLGKGIDSMISSNIEEHDNINLEDKSSQIQSNPNLINISDIEPNKKQPRKDFDEETLLELSSSIKEYGILQPLLVKKNKDYYELIAGERRWRAAKLAGLKKVPVIIGEYTDKEVMEISLIENIQRENLNPIEEALAYQQLIKEFDLKQEELAERVSKSRSVITNTMRLLKLDKRVQEMLSEKEISMGHARALLSIEDKDLQFSYAQKIVNEALSVREIEIIVKEMLEPKNEVIKNVVKKEKNENIFYKDVENRIRGILGTKVSINEKNANKGKIEIEYYSLDELERLIDLFGSIETN
jgi:ParB-like partition proteins